MGDPGSDIQQRRVSKPVQVQVDGGAELRINTPHPVPERVEARFAAELQQRLGRIPADRVLQPGPDGAYRLAEADLRWQLEMFTDRGAS